MNSPKNLIALSLFLLLGAAVFGVLSGSKVKTLRNDVAATTAQKETAESARAAVEKEVKAREAKVATDLAKVTENESRVASAEAEVVKTQTEKSDLQAKLQANETQISELQKHIDEMTKAPPKPDPGAPSVSELQAQLDDARKQLDNAEREKQLITQNIRTPEARAAPNSPSNSAIPASAARSEARSWRSIAPTISWC